MAANPLIDAFEVCVSQVARGQSIAQVIAQYPQFADDLRLMLAAGDAAARYGLPAAEVDAARARMQPRIDDLIDGFPDRGLPPWVIPLGIIVVVVVIILLLASQPGGIFATAPVPTPTTSASPTPSATLTSTATPSATLTQTSTASPLPTVSVGVCTQAVVLEGPIEAIRGNHVVIFGMSVVVANPSRYSVGLIVRAEGCTCDDDSCAGVPVATVIIPTRAPAVIQPTSTPTPGGSTDPGGGSPPAGSGDDGGDDDGGDD